MIYKILSSDIEITHQLYNCFERYPDDCISFVIDSNGRSVFEIKESYMDDVIKKISDIIAEYVFSVAIESEIKQYSMLETRDKKRVAEIMNYRKYHIIEGFIFNCRRKIKNFFIINNTFNLDGFIDFCTIDYVEEIEFILDDVVDEYFTHNEYREFLMLLRYYIEVEEPRFGKLIVETDEKGEYKYYDCNCQDITEKCYKNFLNEFNDKFADKDDRLISILIMMLPEKIFIYGTRNIMNNNMLETLKEIFENRIQLHPNDCMAIKK